LANRLWVDFRGAAGTGPVYQTRLDDLVRYLQGRPAADRPERGSAVQWPAGPDGERVRPAGALRAVLGLSAGEVSLGAGDAPVTQRPGGLRWLRLEGGRALGWGREVGRRLSADFLAGPVGAALAARVGEAAGLNEVLELAVEVTGPELADLPWEALQVPQASGEIAEVGGSPLALHRNVALYRLVAGLGTAPAHKVKGPL